MVTIIPAILPASFRAIEAGVGTVSDIVQTVQIDFVDGTFAPNKTWWFNGKDTDRVSRILSEDEGMPLWEEMNYEFDLMLADPLATIDTFIALGPSRIIFHIESITQASLLAYFETLPEIVRETINFGLALGIDTDPNMIAPYSEYIDTIQCMGIAKVGFQGQPFDARVIEQVRAVKALYPTKTISVDGAVGMDTIASLAHAGADTFVVGSAIFESVDPRGTIDALCREATSASSN